MRARAESARLSSPKGERLGTTFQQTLIATSVAAENLRRRAAVVNGFVRQFRYEVHYNVNKIVWRYP
jgi:hypothetical protein